MSMMLSANAISKIYMSGTRQIRAVDGVSCEIARGAVVSIIGPSGAGKSTLLHILGGLDLPTGGEVRLGGASLYALPDADRAALRNTRLGFVFQFYHLLPELTALENVMLPAFMRVEDAEHKASGRQAVRERAAGLLRLVGLEERIDHRPGKLSGGEAQRVAIARALINRPDFLLCDEPTGNLDSGTSESIYELLLTLKATTGMAVVIVTHDESLARKADRTIRIKDGKII